MAKIVNVVYKVDDKALIKAKTEIQGIEKETKDSEREMVKLNNTISKTGQQGSQSFLSFKNVLSTVSTAALIAGVIQLGRKIFDLGVKQEQLNIAFTTFLGSAAKAKILLADLSKFAIVTPFTPDQVNNAAKALLAFGVQGKDIIPTLKMLGDVSAGTGKDLTEMAIIFGQIRSTGRLMGQDLLQLINAGFNPLQIISEQTGKSVAQLKDEMEKGAISFEMVAGAFKSATSEGGLFFNLMEKQSQSIGGITSTISGNLEELGKQIFEVFQGATAGVAGFFAEWTGGLIALSEEEQKALKLSGELYLFQQRNLLATNQTLEERTKTIKNIVEAEKALGKFQPGTTEDPLPWADKDAGAIKIGIIEGLNKKLDALKIARDRALSITELKGINKEIAELEKRLKELTGGDNKKLEERAKALDKLRGVGKRLGKDIFEGNKEADEKESKRQSDATTRELKQAADRAELLKANNKDMEDEITRQLEEAADERIRIANEEAANREAAMQRAYDLALELGAASLANSLMQREIDTQNISDKYERELELAGDNDRAKKEIERKREEELRVAEKKNKEIQKQNARRQIGIDTAVAIIKTFSQFGYPAGILPAALMAGIGFIQTKNVQKLAKGKVLIDGPGTTTSDSIPALLSKKESVINAEASMASPNLLNAINDRKIDDRVLGRIAASGGSRGVGIDYERLGEEFRKGRESYETHGYTVMKGIQKGKNFKQIIRSKVQGY